MCGCAVAADGPDLAVPLPAACTAKTDALGISRVVEIDTAAGPRFGSQYRDNDFLADGEVVLTFDDGPAGANTMAVLEALDAECTRATFFAVGRMAVTDPETIKEVARRGHTIGVHTWSHRNQKSISAAKAKDEIELGLSAVASIVGSPPSPFFRFPYLADTRASLAHLESRGFGIFSIDVDSKDFATRKPETVLRNVMTQLGKTGKGIILFHDLQASTAHALPRVLAALREGGFKVVHLIAKTPATTLPEYDAELAKELERRKGLMASVAGESATATEAEKPAGTAGAPSAGAPGRVQPATSKKAGARVKQPFWKPSEDVWQLKGYIGQ